MANFSVKAEERGSPETEAKYFLGSVLGRSGKGGVS
jgi:hypothetical protein